MCSGATKTSSAHNEPKSSSVSSTIKTTVPSSSSKKSQDSGSSKVSSKSGSSNVSSNSGSSKKSSNSGSSNVSSNSRSLKVASKSDSSKVASKSDSSKTSSDSGSLKVSSDSSSSKVSSKSGSLKTSCTSSSIAKESSVSVGTVCSSSRRSKSNNVLDQIDTSKIFRFFRVPGNRFKNLEEVLKHHGYQIKKKVAEGDYSVLHLATYKTNILVACKLIEMKKIHSVLTSREISRADNSPLSYIKNELYMLKYVSCPYILKLYYHFVVNKVLYIFLKLAPEGNLAKYVREKGPLSESQSVVIFSQMAVVLEYLYNLRISHRALQMEAILLIGAPAKDLKKLIIMVTNFGLSRFVSATTNQTGLCYTICGNYEYMAPEVLDNKPYNPFQVDIWMAGITLYAMMNKVVPYAKDDYKEQLRAQCSIDWKWTPQVKPSSNLNALMTAILQPDPAARIKTDALVAHPWVASEFKRAKGRFPQNSKSSGSTNSVMRPGEESLESNRSKGSESSKKAKH